MPLRFSIRIGCLREVNLVLLTGLKETLKSKRERILEISKEMEEYVGKTTGLKRGSESQTRCSVFFSLFKVLSVTEGLQPREKNKRF